MQSPNNQPTSKWYDNNVLVNILLFVFFPVGLYALWKSNTIAKWWKVTGTINSSLFALGLIGWVSDTSHIRASGGIDSFILNWLIFLGIICFIGFAINSLLTKIIKYQ